MRIEEVSHGIFRCEIKNRFRASVEVDGTAFVCYVASSCRLSNFLELRDRDVLLLPRGENSSATNYTLYAARYKNSYILLELSMANATLSEQLYRKYFSFLGKRKRISREKTVSGYKSDLYIEDTNTIVEIKTVIAETKIAVFPSVHSDRCLEQLIKIENLLVKGQKVCYLFAVLCSAVKRIEIEKNTEFYRRFIECIEKGMIYKACKFKTTECDISVNGMLPVDI